MKKICAAAGMALLTLFAGIAADAYTNYCDGITVASVDAEYTVQLKDIGTQLDICIEELQNPPADLRTAEATAAEGSHTGEAPASAEVPAGEESALSEEPAAESTDSMKTLIDLYTQRIELFGEYSAELSDAEYDMAIDLIDYDILLKKLKLLSDEYRELKQKAHYSTETFRIGGCDLSVVDADNKAVESKYFDIEALLYEISALKTKIESLTGIKLTSSLDYEQAYLITDVIKLDPGALTMINGGASLCIPQGTELKESEAPDISGQYNTALQCYYTLGAAMREYVAAQENIRKCESAFKLGDATAEQLNALSDEKTAAYMNACTAKAELAKSLIELDRASGGALTNHKGISGNRAAAYRSAVSEEQSGSGLWIVGSTPGGAVFMPAVLPKGVYPDEEDIVTYSLKYNGKKLCSGGGFCFIQPQEYNDECRYAQITYYINGMKTGVYKVDVLSPYGEFIG